MLVYVVIAAIACVLAYVWYKSRKQPVAEHFGQDSAANAHSKAVADRMRDVPPAVKYDTGDADDAESQMRAFVQADAKAFGDGSYDEADASAAAVHEAEELERERLKREEDEERAREIEKKYKMAMAEYDAGQGTEGARTPPQEIASQFPEAMQRERRNSDMVSRYESVMEGRGSTVAKQTSRPEWTHTTSVAKTDRNDDFGARYDQLMLGREAMDSNASDRPPITETLAMPRSQSDRSESNTDLPHRYEQEIETRKYGSDDALIEAFKKSSNARPSAHSTALARARAGARQNATSSRQKAIRANHNTRSPPVTV